MNLAELSINLLTEIMFLYFISQTIPLKKISWFYRIIAISPIVIAISLMNLLAVPATITSIIGLILEIIYTIIFSETNVGTSIFFGAVPTVLCVISDTITFTVISTFFSDISSALTLNTHLRTQALLIYIFTYSTLILVISKLINKDIKYPKCVPLIIFIICSLGIFASDVLLKYSFVYEQEDFSVSIISLSTINYIFISVFFSLLIFIEILGIYFRKYIELQEQNTLYKIEEQELANLRESTAFIRGWKHDYSNQLQVISSMLESNNIESAKNYICDILTHSTTIKPIFNTNNQILDSILSLKYCTMEENKITFDYSIYLPDNLQISSLNLSTLFTNILDNAIEANLKLSSERFIKLSIKPKEEMLIITLENATDGQYVYDKKGNLRSSKSEKNHGYGMQQIINTIEQIGGFYKITAGEQLFTIEIAIPAFD